MRKGQSRNGDASNGLSQLLETEARLEVLLEDARHQADAMVHDAEARAWASLQAVDRELAEVATRASQARAEAVAERIQSLTVKREQALRRIRAIDDAQIGVLAAWVSEQVLGQLTTSGTDP